MSDEVEVDTERLRRALAGLVESNQHNFAVLQAAGMQFDGTAILMARVEGMIEALFPDGGVDRMNLDLVFERRVADFMARGHVQLAERRANERKEAEVALDVRPADYDVIDPA